MELLQSVIIGIVQGLTEFLPVSSSGHIIIAEKLLSVSIADADMMLISVMMHLGTLLAVVIVFWDKLINMVKHPLKSDLKWLILATLPAVAAALLVDFDEAFEGNFLGWSFLVTSMILICGEFINRDHKRHSNLHRHVHFKDAIVMGIMQAVAILPGVSRSGSTIAGGCATGLSRRRAANFAFLMCVPAILGSVVLEAKDIIVDRPEFTVGILPLLAGTAAAFVAGFIAIKSMIRLIRKISLNWFAAYTFLLGLAVLADKYYFHKWF